MSTQRRLADTLHKFRDAREQLIRDMGIGQPLTGAEASRQLGRLKELHEAIVIMQAAINESEDVHRERERRENAGSPAERRASLLASAALGEPAFRPL